MKAGEEKQRTDNHIIRQFESVRTVYAAGAATQPAMLHIKQIIMPKGE